MESRVAKSQSVYESILLEEYKQLSDLIQNTTTLRDGRLNFLLATISGAFVGLGLISESQIDKIIVEFISASIIIGIFIIGLVNFRNVVSNNFFIVICQRGLNRIRHYFVKNHQKTSETLFIFPHNDDLPEFADRFPKLTVAINSIIAGIGVPLLLTGTFAAKLIWLYTSGLLIFIAVYLAHYGYFRIFARRQEKSFKVLFPSEAI